MKFSSTSFFSTDKLYGCFNFIFKQDVAPAQATKMTTFCFYHHGIDVLYWPAEWPDLNLIIYFMWARWGLECRWNHILATWTFVLPQQSLLTWICTSNVQSRTYYHHTENSITSTLSCKLELFAWEKGILNAICLFCCYIQPSPSPRSITNTQTETAAKLPTEDRHHITTEVVNRPSEAFLKGVSSSASIEPLSDY